MNPRQQVFRFEAPRQEDGIHSDLNERATFDREDEPMPVDPDVPGPDENPGVGPKRVAELRAIYLAGRLAEHCRLVRGDDSPSPPDEKGRPIQHGTQGGYQAESRRQLEHCDACRLAHAVNHAAWVSKRKAATQVASDVDGASIPPAPV